MQKIKVLGKRIDSSQIKKEYQLDDSDYHIQEFVNLTVNRSEAQELTLENLKGEELVNLYMEDGTEWIGSALDIMEVHGDNILNRNRGSDVMEFPSSISANSQNRGIIDFAIKCLGRIRSRIPAKDIIIQKSAQKIDNYLVEKEGLYQVSKSWKFSEFKGSKNGNNKFLIFIHGTFSSTNGSFKDIGQNGLLLDSIFKKYGDNVLAFEHHTILKSPVQNAIDLMEQLPNGAEIDIVSHSRGGIIADIVSRCDINNEFLGFVNEELGILEKEEKSTYDLILKLNQKATHKKIKVGRISRVAAPVYGTTLMSERLDHYLNGVLNAIGLILPDKTNILYGYIKKFLMDVIRSRTDVHKMPGLSCMVPECSLLCILNNPNIEVNSDLVVIEGDTNIGGGLGNSLAVILSNLFYWDANDFVVDTSSMRQGVSRKSNIQFYNRSSSDISHFKYFSNIQTVEVLKKSITSDPYSRINACKLANQDSGDRGIILGKLSWKEEKTINVSGNKPIVIILPGIMGSNLYSSEERIWLDFEQIYKGKMKESLDINSPEVQAKSAVGKYYSALVKDLIDNDNDVHIFPYDWRLSLTSSVVKLKDTISSYLENFNQPIKIIAHSMGGLVVRELILNDQDFWNNYIKQVGSQFIMLGTPWKGSYLIMEILTGDGGSLKKIATLDFQNSKRELLSVINQYPGVYQLLPIDDKNIEKGDFWQNILDEVGNDFPLPPSLQFFEDYKDKILTAFGKSDHILNNLTNTYYIAGKSDGTVYDYYIKNSWFKTCVKYRKTPEGDGSVTWESGIPKGIDKDRVYFADVQHGELANNPIIFKGIREIFERGASNSLFKTKGAFSSISRGGSDTQTITSVLSKSHGIDAIFGIQQKGESSTSSPLNIEVSLAHLKVAKFPVLVGHFEGDGIVSAERAIDQELNFVLSERYDAGIYPGDVGQNTIVFNPNNRFKGAVVVGLGDNSLFNGYKLMRTVEAGVLNYVMHIRDNSSDSNKNSVGSGISSLLIGSGYGRLSLKSSLEYIIKGIQKANDFILNYAKDLHPIQSLEFIEYYKDNAYNAFKELKKLEKANVIKNISISNKVKEKYGFKERLPEHSEDFWWHHFSTCKVKSKQKNENSKFKVKFTSSAGQARIESETYLNSEALINALLKNMEKNPQWDYESSKTLFEILIPNNFKEIVRNQNNILWKLDIDMAALPWEMFHDRDYDEHPTFTSAGLIRQLYTENYRPDPIINKVNNILIISDPIYNDPRLSQLPGAFREGHHVEALIDHEIYKVDHLPQKSGSQNVNQIFNNRYKIIHIAGHGLYDPESDQAGVALGDNIFFDASLASKLSYLPEFVFLNCCLSGKVDAEDDRYTENKYKLAANIGTQLIKLGVHAVVITGWEVNDQAALNFADVFYSLMFDGETFGEAVRRARNKIYQDFPKNKTWAAYQCYGDPWYKFTNKRKLKDSKPEYLFKEQVLIDLKNLRSKIRGKGKEHNQWVEEELKEKIEAAKLYDLYEGDVMELEAFIYAELNMRDKALEKFDMLRKVSESNYSVKCLQELCNLRSKLYINENSIEYKSRALADLEMIKHIGENAERLSLLASTYKRLVRFDVENREDHLFNMIENYRKAFRSLGEGDFKQLCYPFINIVAGNWSRKKHRAYTLFYNRRETKLPEVISDLKNKCENTPSSYDDFWDDTNLLRLMICEILYLTKNIDVENHVLKIKQGFENIWPLSGSGYYAEMDKEHINYLLETTPYRPNHPVNKGLKELQKYFESKLKS